MELKEAFGLGVFVFLTAIVMVGAFRWGVSCGRRIEEKRTVVFKQHAAELVFLTVNIRDKTCSFDTVRCLAGFQMEAAGLTHLTDKERKTMAAQTDAILSLGPKAQTKERPNLVYMGHPGLSE